MSSDATSATVADMTEPEREREWIDAGLLMPDAKKSDERRALLQWMTERSIHLDQMVAASREGQLGSLAGDLELRPGDRITLEQLAAFSGTPLELARDLRRASGFAPMGDGFIYTAADVEMFRLFKAASAVFSSTELLHFSRVVGSSMRRIAEAASEMFLLDVEAPQVGTGESTELERAIANLEAIELSRGVTALFDPLFRWHLELAVRTTRAARADSSDYSTVTLSVGFVDLSGFTSRAGLLSADDLLGLVLEFETEAYDLVADHGGRLVKLIGDEAMFATVEPSHACEIASRLVARFTREVGSSARGGVAYGPVVAHGGDLYGDTVNLASRIADIAIPGEVLVTAEVVDHLGIVGVDPAGRRQLKGFPAPVPLWSLR